MRVAHFPVIVRQEAGGFIVRPKIYLDKGTEGLAILHHGSLLEKKADINHILSRKEWRTLT